MDDVCKCDLRHARSQHKSLICYPLSTSFTPPQIREMKNLDLDESQKLPNQVHEPWNSVVPQNFLMPVMLWKFMCVGS